MTLSEGGVLRPLPGLMARRRMSMNETPHGKAAFAINTYSFSRDRSAHDCLQRLAEAGYRRFEVMLIPGHFWPTLDGAAGRRAVEDLVVRNALEIVTLNQPNLDVNLASD